MTSENLVKTKIKPSVIADKTAAMIWEMGTNNTLSLAQTLEGCNKEESAVLKAIARRFFDYRFFPNCSISLSNYAPKEEAKQ